MTQPDIPCALSERVAAYARERRLSPPTLARWQAWPEEDKAALLVLARELQLNENHLRDFLDWLEEIAVRDRCRVADLLTAPAIQQPLTAHTARSEKLKGVKEALRKIRYPRLSRLEADLRAAVKALDLGRQVRISFPPALEGDAITVTLTARNVRELADCLTRLHQRIEDGRMQKVFDLLDQA
ncbi:MAG: hypothetical protein NZ578_02205 [Candidatus Binatia bacterium]|nr:hypothetical protein [Candidatus Binatia bacterium]